MDILASTALFRPHLRVVDPLQHPDLCRAFFFMAALQHHATKHEPLL